MSAVAATTAGPPPAAGAAARLTARADALALGIGSRITASTLILACVIVIMAGASSLLSALKQMDRDLKVMHEQLLIANKGNDMLNKTMDSLPPTSDSLKGIVATVRETRGEAGKSKAALDDLAVGEKQINADLAGIAASTAAMRGSMEAVQGGTGDLKRTVDDLNAKVDPLARTQNRMLGETRRMQVGMNGMNASLAYVIRTLNYITAPPTGEGFKVRVEMDKKALPPVPGVKATADPIEVYRRGAWPIYGGP